MGQLAIFEDLVEKQQTDVRLVMSKKWPKLHETMMRTYRQQMEKLVGTSGESLTLLARTHHVGPRRNTTGEAVRTGPGNSNNSTRNSAR